MSWLREGSGESPATTIGRRNISLVVKILQDVLAVDCGIGADASPESVAVDGPLWEIQVWMIVNQGDTTYTNRVVY